MTSVAFGKSGFKVHALKGRLRGCFSVNITRAYRIVFVLNIDEICFIDIGDHDDVCR